MKVTTAIAAAAKDLSVEKNIQHLIARPVEGAPLESVERFADRLQTAALTHMTVNAYKSVLAWQVRQMKVEEDWRFFLPPDSTEPYGVWDEFHEDLVAAIGVSESASWAYQRTVRYAEEALGLDEDEFLAKGGITTVSKMLDMSSGCRKGEESWESTVRPKTTKFGKTLSSYQCESYGGARGSLRAFFDEHVGYDYASADASNKPASELNALVDETLGRPKVWFEWEGSVLIANLIYPNGDSDQVRFIPDGLVAPPIRDRIIKRLSISEE